MGRLSKLVSFTGQQKRELRKARIDNKCENNKLSVELSNNQRITKKSLVSNEISNMQGDEQLRVEKILLRQSKKTGKMYMLYAMIASIISSIFSICGLNGVKYISDAFIDIPHVMVTMVFIFFSLVNVSISYNSAYHEKEYYNEYNKLKVFQMVFISTSIVSNVIFLRLQNINLILSIILSCLLDISSVFCCNVANCRKYKNKSYSEGQQDENVFNMMMFIIVNRFTQRIKSIYMAEKEQYIPAAESCKISNITCDDSQENDDDCKIVPNGRNLSGKRNNPIRKSSSKTTKEKFIKLVEKVPEGEKVTPSRFNMQGNRNFYNWADETELLNKTPDGYVRVV